MTASTKIEKIETRGRPRTYADKFAIVDDLKAVRDGASLTRHLKLQLFEKGLLTTEKVKATKGRGAPRVVYKLTNKGKSYINLSKSWKRT